MVKRDDYFEIRNLWPELLDVYVVVHASDLVGREELWPDQNFPWQLRMASYLAASYRLCWELAAYMELVLSTSWNMETRYIFAICGGLH